jgi:hypothetical protein
MLAITLNRIRAEQSKAGRIQPGHYQRMSQIIKLAWAANVAAQYRRLIGKEE